MDRWDAIAFFGIIVLVVSVGSIHAASGGIVAGLCLVWAGVKGGWAYSHESSNGQNDAP